MMTQEINNVIEEVEKLQREIAKNRDQANVLIAKLDGLENDCIDANDDDIKTAIKHLVTAAANLSKDQ